MVGVAVIGVVAVTSALTYSKTIQALAISQSRGMASRLAQDKFETLGGLAYVNLLVTSQADLDTLPNVWTDGDGVSRGADQTNYPPESFNMAAKTFQRMTAISRVYKDANNNIHVLSPDSADTGLKQITVVVQYVQGSEQMSKTYSLVVSDMHLVPLNSMVYGTVTDTSLDPIETRAMPTPVGPDA